MGVLQKVAASAGALKIFPLPPVVMFPGTTVPLHIFEPRYRQLVGDALAADRVMAIGGHALDGSGSGSENDSDAGAELASHAPPLSRICCVGVISAAEQLADGRYLIVLEGVARARLIHELPHRKLYREISAEILEDPPYEGDDEEPVRQAVLELAALLPRDASAPLLHHAALHSGGTLADVVASALVADVSRRRALLEELDPGVRLRAVLGELTAVIVQLSALRSATASPGSRLFPN